jgi:hypothetical protein
MIASRKGLNDASNTADAFFGCPPATTGFTTYNNYRSSISPELLISSLSLSESFAKRASIDGVSQFYSHHNPDLKVFERHVNGTYPTEYNSPKSVDQSFSFTSSPSSNFPADNHSPMEIDTHVTVTSGEVAQWTKPLNCPPVVRLLTDCSTPTFRPIQPISNDVTQHSSLQAATRDLAAERKAGAKRNMKKDIFDEYTGRHTRSKWSHLYCLSHVVLLAACIVLALLLAQDYNGYSVDSDLDMTAMVNSNDFQNRIDALKTKLENKLYGQHIAVGYIIASVQQYLTDVDDHGSVNIALVLSFQGPVGVGKTYTGQIIMDTLTPIESGKCSQVFVYSDNVQSLSLVRQFANACIANCMVCVVVIDDVNYVSPAIIDDLKNGLLLSLRHHRKMIVLLLSTTNETGLVDHYLLQVSAQGRLRESVTRQEILDLQLDDRSDTMKGKSSLSLANISVPFLPLERHHIIRCCQSAWELSGSRNRQQISSEVLNQVLRDLTFYPAERKTFAAGGCRKVAEILARYS